ncbi:uncharacterized protein [Nicotiana tomentosiformis]|uniref:uncharacterized protein n=1 Tax=Nicotiana tomentosiformis TaxID=4098 RepID=UPI00388CE7A3
MVDNYKQWNEKLQFALLEYRTTVRTSTGETPYLLVYGIEVVIPAKVEIPSLRIIQEAELRNVEWVRSWYEQLAPINGKKMNVVLTGGALILTEMDGDIWPKPINSTQSRDTTFMILFAPSI